MRHSLLHQRQAVTGEKSVALGCGQDSHGVLPRSVLRLRTSANRQYPPSALTALVGSARAGTPRRLRRPSTPAGPAVQTTTIGLVEPAAAAQSASTMMSS